MNTTFGAYPLQTPLHRRANPYRQTSVIPHREGAPSHVIDVSFARRALGILGSLARLSSRENFGDRDLAAGLMIAPRFLLTTHQDLPSEAAALGAHVTVLDYTRGCDVPGTLTFDLNPSDLFVTSRSLNYTILAVREVSTSGRDIRDLNIVGFHGGVGGDWDVRRGQRLKTISAACHDADRLEVHDGRVTEVTGAFFAYDDAGATAVSGGAIFSDRWDVVGIQGARRPATDAQGRVLNQENRPWRQSMGEHAIQWTRREGTQIASIVADALSRVRDRQSSSLKQMLLHRGRVSENTRPAASNAHESFNEIFWLWGARV